MEYRTHQGFRLSEIGMGCYALSGVYGHKDPLEFQRTLRRAHDLGVNFFDTAEVYGDAEQILGETTKSFREKIYLATKVGIKKGTTPGVLREYINNACNQSLHNLQTDVIDLYQIHFDDPDITIEVIIATLEKLVQAGKIRRYGVGHLSMERAHEYLDKGHIFSMLIELSPVAREEREGLLPLCKAYGTGVIAFSVTGRGLLTGRIRPGHWFAPGDIRRIDPLFQRERFEAGLRTAEKLNEIGQRHGKSAAQTAIAWTLAQPGVICALTGPSTQAHLEENVAAVDWTLTKDEMNELETFFSAEDGWLKTAQGTSIRQILITPFDNPQAAFTDLVYVIETAVLLDLIEEAQVMPLFYSLYGLRNNLDAGALPKLTDLQKQLKSLIRT